jgi:hypothetical protein
MTSSIFDNVRLDVEVPKRFPLGEPVPITLALRNSGDRHVDLYVTGRPIAFDIVITAPDETVVWRRQKGRTIAAILQVLELKPHSTLELRDDWMQRSDSGVPVEPGTYFVRGELPIERQPPLVSSTATLELV